jgi:hypothetical protein
VRDLFLSYSQQASFQNLDLYHEEVIELDNPFSDVVASNAKGIFGFVQMNIPNAVVLSFLVLGDQNAGKSTFIHSFAYHPDKNYIVCYSLLFHLSMSHKKLGSHERAGNTFLHILQFAFPLRRFSGAHGRAALPGHRPGEGIVIAIVVCDSVLKLLVISIIAVIVGFVCLLFLSGISLIG